MERYSFDPSSRRAKGRPRLEFNVAARWSTWRTQPPLLSFEVSKPKNSTNSSGIAPLNLHVHGVILASQRDRMHVHWPRLPAPSSHPVLVASIGPLLRWYSAPAHGPIYPRGPLGRATAAKGALSRIQLAHGTTGIWQPNLTDLSNALRHHFIKREDTSKGLLDPIGID